MLVRVLLLVTCTSGGGHNTVGAEGEGPWEAGRASCYTRLYVRRRPPNGRMLRWRCSRQALPRCAAGATVAEHEHRYIVDGARVAKRIPSNRYPEGGQHDLSLGCGVPSFDVSLSLLRVAKVPACRKAIRFLECRLRMPGKGIVALLPLSPSRPIGCSSHTGAAESSSSSTERDGTGQSRYAVWDHAPVKRVRRLGSSIWLYTMVRAQGCLFGACGS